MPKSGPCRYRGCPHRSRPCPPYRGPGCMFSAEEIDGDFEKASVCNPCYSARAKTNMLRRRAEKAAAALAAEVAKIDAAVAAHDEEEAAAVRAARDREAAARDRAAAERERKASALLLQRVSEIQRAQERTTGGSGEATPKPLAVHREDRGPLESLSGRRLDPDRVRAATILLLAGLTRSQATDVLAVRGGDISLCSGGAWTTYSNAVWGAVEVVGERSLADERLAIVKAGRPVVLAMDGGWNCPRQATNQVTVMTTQGNRIVALDVSQQSVFSTDSSGLKRTVFEGNYQGTPHAMEGAGARAVLAQARSTEGFSALVKGFVVDGDSKLSNMIKDFFGPGANIKLDPGHWRKNRTKEIGQLFREAYNKKKMGNRATVPTELVSIATRVSNWFMLGLKIVEGELRDGHRSRGSALAEVQRRFALVVSHLFDPECAVDCPCLYTRAAFERRAHAPGTAHPPAPMDGGLSGAPGTTGFSDGHGLVPGLVRIAAAGSWPPGATTACDARGVLVPGETVRDAAVPVETPGEARPRESAASRKEDCEEDVLSAVYDDSKASELLPEYLREAVEQATVDAVADAHSVVHGWHTNYCEGFHSYRLVLTPKRIHTSRSWKGRCLAAAVLHNRGRGYLYSAVLAVLGTTPPDTDIAYFSRADDAHRRRAEHDRDPERVRQKALATRRLRAQISKPDSQVNRTATYLGGGRGAMSDGLTSGGSPPAVFTFMFKEGAAQPTAKKRRRRALGDTAGHPPPGAKRARTGEAAAPAADDVHPSAAGASSVKRPRSLPEAADSRRKRARCSQADMRAAHSSGATAVKQCPACAKFFKAAHKCRATPA